MDQQLNTYGVNVTISNVWIPKDLAVPDPASAQTVIEGTPGAPPKLVVTSPVGTVPTQNGPGTYNIELSYSGVPAQLNVLTLGVWLPPGFTLVPGSSNLIDTKSGNAKMYTTETTTAYESGQAVVWSFSSYPLAGDSNHSVFPGIDVSLSPLDSTVTFQFNGPAGQNPDAVAWITQTWIWEAD